MRDRNCKPRISGTLPLTSFHRGPSHADLESQSPRDRRGAPVGGRRTRYRIEGIEGLWLDVSATGRRYWYVRYQPGGRQTRTERWYRLGDAESVGLADAAKRTRDVLTAAYAKERDPHAERAAKRSETLTFGDLFDDWYARHAEPTLARAATDMSIYKTHLQGGLAKQRVTALKRAEIGRLRDSVAKNFRPDRLQQCAHPDQPRAQLGGR